MTYLLLTWRPRHYYILRNKTSGKKYVGQTTQDITKYLGSGPHWINHCKKHGGYNRKNIEVIWAHFFICEKSAQLWLDQFALDNPNYDLKSNKKWANQCLENTLDNPFYGGTIQSESNQKRLDDGTHNWLGGEQQRDQQLERVSDGSHHFLGDGTFQREVQMKLIEAGTHHFLGDGSFQSKTNQKRLDDGTHNLLGGKAIKEKIAAGTYHTLGPEQNKKMLSNGTHATQIRLCCLGCRKDVPKNIFSRDHKNCSGFA